MRTDGQLPVDALERIEIVDGVERLDGWPLPAANDAVFDPHTIRLTTHMLETRQKLEAEGGMPDEYSSFLVPETGSEWVAWDEVSTFESTLTNNEAREANIRTIASGAFPLYIRWEDIPLRHPQSFPRRAAAAALRLLAD
ncbi:MAG TPA: hypothetical protein VK674_01695 [Candidatus Limnocylindria bacterium]|nr:hypothetical protein [Candidatus Limnocylindria bacterium]